MQGQYNDTSKLAVNSARTAISHISTLAVRPLLSALGKTGVHASGASARTSSLPVKLAGGDTASPALFGDCVTIYRVGLPGGLTLETSGPALAPDEAKAETTQRRRVESPQPGNNWRPRPAIDPRDMWSHFGCFGECGGALGGWNAPRRRRGNAGPEGRITLERCPLSKASGCLSERVGRPWGAVTSWQCGHATSTTGQTGGSMFLSRGRFIAAWPAFTQSPGGLSERGGQFYPDGSRGFSHSFTIALTQVPKVGG